jgi:hypothetical protein
MCCAGVIPAVFVGGEQRRDGEPFVGAVQADFPHTLKKPGGAPGFFGAADKPLHPTSIVRRSFVYSSVPVRSCQPLGLFVRYGALTDCLVPR